MCLNAEKGICKFGKTCWYLHEDIENENNETKNGLRIFLT